MQRTILLCGALSAAAAIDAQTLDHPANVPVVGDAYTLQVGAYVAPLPAGSGVDFDMTGMVSTGQRSYAWMDPNVYSEPDSLPGADACLVGGVNSDTLMYALSAGGLELVGEKKNYLGLLPVVAPYTDGPRELQLPLSYGGSWTDAISSMWTIPGVGNANRSGNITGSADAEGSIRLPGMTEGVPVLRVRTYLVETIIAGIYNITHKRHVHDYHVQWSRWPVFRTVSDSLTTPFGINQFTNYSEWVDPAHLGIQDAAVDPFGLRLSPNPATDRLRLDLYAPGGRMRWEVLSLAGTMVRRGDLGVPGAGELSRWIDLQGLAAGTYQLGVTDAEGRRSMKRFVVVR